MLEAWGKDVEVHHLPAAQLDPLLVALSLSHQFVVKVLCKRKGHTLSRSLKQGTPKFQGTKSVATFGIPSL